jgi:hypothetical protein
MSIGLKGNADGSGAIQVGGTDAITISTSQIVTMNGGTGGLVSLTAKAYNWNGLTTNTSLDFTGLPSWVKRVTVLLNAVSLSGTDNILVQIGSGSLTTSGYVSGGYGYGATISSTAGFIVPSNSAARLTTAQVVITNVSGNIWIASCVFGAEIATVGGGVSTGTITIGGALDRVSVTRTGTNTFDAGSINILYE